MAADGGSLAARTDLKDARGLRGHPILVNAIAIAGTPWLMIAKMDQDNAHAGIQITAWITGIVAGLVLLLLYGAGYLLWRQAAARLAGEGWGEGSEGVAGGSVHPNRSPNARGNLHPRLGGFLTDVTMRPL